jgi:sortase A
MRRIVSVAGWTMIWSGLIIFGYVGFQLYGTDLIAARDQASARAELEERLAAPAGDTTTTSTAEGEPPLVPEPAPEAGTAFAVIRIPDIGVDQVLFSGVDTETLQLGPGHMPETPLPGQPGNSVVSGHRTTYGRPFFDLDLLVEGDIIEVESTIGTHVYQVRETQVVLPVDVWVIDPRPGAWLTLTTCNPRWSARERLVVFAEMVEGPNLEYVAAA